MFDQRIFLKKQFGEEPSKIVDTLLYMTSSTGVFLANPTMANSNNEYTLEFSKGIKLNYRPGRDNNEIVITGNNVLCAYRYKKNGNPIYLEYSQETEDSGVIHLEMTNMGNGALEHYSGDTCAYGNLNYASNFYDAKENGFMPEHTMPFKARGKFNTGDVLTALEATENLRNRIDRSITNRER